MVFLDLPDTFHENDFRRALVKGMREFILELGKDFTFIGEEYPIQVGGEDYRIDLLFFHRGLHCLVAMELKVGKFKPEYVSKMDFYLEGLDRQIKKPDENPSALLHGRFSNRALFASLRGELSKSSLLFASLRKLVGINKLQKTEKALVNPAALCYSISWCVAKTCRYLMPGITPLVILSGVVN